MGCDIHVHVEIKVAGKWEHYNHPRVGRWYELFARMADVRNDGGVDPIARPRGMPDGCSVGTLVSCRADDGHSHSWLDALEIALLDKWVEAEAGEGSVCPFEDNFGYLFGNSFSGFLTRGRDGGYPEEVEDVRFVFWFDS